MNRRISPNSRINPVPEAFAAPVQMPAPSRGLQRAREECGQYRLERERLERRSMVRGLILLALVALAVSVARAGVERVFVPGWWRP